MMLAIDLLVKYDIVAPLFCQIIMVHSLLVLVCLFLTYRAPEMRLLPLTKQKRRAWYGCPSLSRMLSLSAAF